MELRERIAAALYDDNLRQINASEADRATRHGNNYKAMVMTQAPFAEADETLRKVYLSYADAAIAQVHRADVEEHEAESKPSMTYCDKPPGDCVLVLGHDGPCDNIPF